MIPVLHGVWAAAGGVVGDFELIETQTVGAGGATSITFSSIPGTYKHLQLRAIARNTSTAGGGIRFNGDTGNNYARHFLSGDGASASSGATTSASNMDILGSSSGTALASTFTVNVVDILDYASTSKTKTTRLLRGDDYNGSGGVLLMSGLWNSTSAVTSLALVPSTNFVQYSTFSLYGVK